MFDNLADRLQGALRTIRGDAALTAENIEEAIREVRKSLLEADVSLKVVKLFISRVRQKALGTEVLDSVSPDQQFIKVVFDELVTILGGENVPLDLKGGPSIIMMLGLQGSGKTTACGKLALKLKKEGHNPLLVACDVQRPAAIMQLQTLGKQIDVPVFTIAGSTDVQEIGEQAVEEAKRIGYNPVILDTAGRLQIDTELMAQVLILDRALEPKEKLLVVDSMTGQEAVHVAETFNTQLDVTGLLLTKVDGDARGGAALSVREAVGKPVKFISTGEKLDQLEAFYPDRMASRILSMGDVVTLVEKAQASIDEKEAERALKQMLTEDLNLETFMQMNTMMKKMGPMGDIMKMMGMGGMLNISSQDQDKIATEGEARMKMYEIAIQSMTVEERRKPEIINMSRRRRIARGSGMKDSEVGQMLNEFEKMRELFRPLRQMMNSMGMGGLMGGLPGMGGMPGGMGGMGAPPSMDSIFGGPGAGMGSGGYQMPRGMPQLPQPGFRPGKGPAKASPPSGFYRKKKKK